MLIVAIVLLLGSAAPLTAQVRQGLGIHGGMTSTTYEFTLTGPGTTSDLDASGPAFGVDFQIPFQGRLSINPFLLIAMEDGDDLLLTDGVSNFVGGTEFELTIIGAQVRYWATETAFIAGQVANYDGELTVDVPAIAFRESVSASAVGMGIAAGFEGESGLSFSVQYATAGGDLDYTGLIFLVGWRFGG